MVFALKEIHDIITAFNSATQEGRQTALATVVHVEGSSYRQPGARMLVTDEGKLTGAISGGCLEGDALRKALLVMSEQKAMLVTYDTSDEDDAKLGVGLGCNGIIHILIEPVDVNDEHNPINLLKMAAAERRKTVLLTIFNLQDRKAHQPGTCWLYRDNGETAGKIEPPFLQRVLEADARQAMQQQSSSQKKYTVEESVFHTFCEFIPPPVSLVIMGAGNDVMPVVQMAHLLGWQTTVVDGRPGHATPARFPLADRVVVARPDSVLSQVAIDDQTVFALMTHNYNYDMSMLRQLVNTPSPYIGVLGPAKKMERMMRELEEEGFHFNKEQLSRVYSPVGLNIGAETAGEIALSVLAEIKAVLSGKQGGSLRNEPTPIHERKKQEIKEVTIKS
jgi:xanthine/CO dehydrogenase XdhC/CoxF family maturation factor